MPDTVARLLSGLFPLINKAFQPFEGSDESVVFGRWDRRFAEILEDDVDVFVCHKTGDSITSWLWASCV